MVEMEVATEKAFEITSKLKVAYNIKVLCITKGSELRQLSVLQFCSEEESTS